VSCSSAGTTRELRAADNHPEADVEGGAHATIRDVHAEAASGRVDRAGKVLVRDCNRLQTAGFISVRRTQLRHCGEGEGQVRRDERSAGNRLEVHPKNGTTEHGCVRRVQTPVEPRTASDADLQGCSNPGGPIQESMHS
jgi:hypothetical protein